MRRRIEALVQRLETTNTQVLGTADILDHYIESVRAHGLHGAAKALENAVGQLHILARLNQKTINETRGESHEPART